MDINKVKEEINKIVASKIGPNLRYKLFLFGPLFNKDSLHNYTFDIGIDSEMEINPLKKIEIMNEINELEIGHNLSFIDFSNVNFDLKRKIFQNCEYIN